MEASFQIVKKSRNLDDGMGVGTDNHYSPVAADFCERAFMVRSGCAVWIQKKLKYLQDATA